MITQDQIDAIGQFAVSRPLSEATVATLRQQFPEIHFTYCMDDDVFAADPVYEHSGFNLYLVDSRNHCLSFTRDPGVATGIVVAELEAE